MLVNLSARSSNPDNLGMRPNNQLSFSRIALRRKNSFHFIHGPMRPVTPPVVPQAGQTFHLFCEISQHLLDALVQHLEQAFMVHMALYMWSQQKVHSFLWEPLISPMCLQNSLCLLFWSGICLQHVWF